jgi:hypothetical protein
MQKHFLSIVFLLSLCLGCGTGEYESRIGQHRGGGAASGVDLGPAEELAGTRVSIRMPACVSLLPANADPKRSRVIPIPIPGLQQRTYEGFAPDASEASIPFYCHVIAIETAKVPGQNIASVVQGALGKLQPGATPQWTDFQATSPEGKESKWQMMRVTLPQEEFYYREKGGKESTRSLPCLVEAYVHEEAGFSVALIWRLPSMIEQNAGNVGLTQLTKPTAGGVSIKPQ